ncbi:MAG: pyridoxamine 5'-phosphate oxidase family protein [Vicinamibacterales bacterium]
MPPLDHPLTANLRERPELGLLVIDPRTRRRLRFNGRGLLSPDGVFLLADEVYGNCPKYIQARTIRPVRCSRTCASSGSGPRLPDNSSTS